MTISPEDVLRETWREGARRDGTRFAFTCPAPRRYKHQWCWDSCFHAVAWSHLEPARAREELRTLLRAGRSDGRAASRPRHRVTIRGIAAGRYRRTERG